MARVTALVNVHGSAVDKIGTLHQNVRKVYRETLARGRYFGAVLFPGTFSVDLQITVDLLSGPLGDIVRERDILMVGESGIFTPEDVKVVQDAGTRAILVGESLVRENDPTAAIKTLLSLE
ncbi:hypothetical protein CYMTET_20205 [Cymbomonas tetramitiformis]|uniref:indole-3-glycerol-phosphate synthase n=1 Tax=Cymbomonas tetramitiformis TaxID=36881 RepID=A0AAE0L471_9CHLO|nr:hypothetical protein CYMTET_20205 [Cymbomonas tetramitiformis]